MSQITLPVYGLLIATPMIIAFGQVLFKMASQKWAASQGSIYSLAFEPIFIVALAIYGGATLLWMYVLKHVPLGHAYSFMALTFVLVPVLATFWLGETITLRYILGASLIIAGLLVVHS